MKIWLFSRLFRLFLLSATRCARIRGLEFLCPRALPHTSCTFRGLPYGEVLEFLPPWVHRERAAVVGMANTSEFQKERILGRVAISRPPYRPPGATGRFNRSLNTGSKAAVPAAYRGALAQGHQVVHVVHEVFGGWGADAVNCDLLESSLTSWSQRTTPSASQLQFTLPRTRL